MILSMTSLVKSSGRLSAGLRHLAAALAVVAFASGTASAQFYTFDAITNNNSADVGIAEGQFRLAVQGSGTTSSFTFTTLGTQQASITDVYFYDPNKILGDITSTNPSITPSPDVLFTRGASPGGLPAYDPKLTAVFSADATRPATGVNSSDDSLKITFTNTIASYQQILAAISAGTLTVGIHVQGFASGGSESLTAVPEPASIAMLGVSSLVGLGYAWRKRKRVVV